MAWQQLGKIPISADWQSYAISSLDDSLLRIQHTYTDKPIGYALLSSVFSDGSRGFFRRIYPDKTQPQLVVLSNEPSVRAAGLNSRILEIKLHPYTRLYSLPWSVEIDIWVNEP